LIRTSRLWRSFPAGVGQVDRAAPQEEAGCPFSFFKDGGVLSCTGEQRRALLGLIKR